MKILITGGAGFIGSHLVEYLLKEKHKITVIDNLSSGRLENLKKNLKKINFVKADIHKTGRWSKNFRNIDIVYHLAALADIVPSIQKPNRYFDSNVIGTRNVINQVIKYKIPKIIYAASSSCYGIPKRYPTKENELLDPKYPYALTKMLGEEIILHFAKLYKFKATSLRLFNVYGPKSRTSGAYGAMFGVFLKQKIEKKPLTVVGNGKQTRDFTFVSDVVRAFGSCLKYNCRKQIINIGSGKTISVNKIVELLKCKKVKIEKRPGEPDTTHANIKLAKKELRWSPKITIKEGIDNLLKDLDYWKRAPLWTPKKIKVATKDWFKHLND